MSPYRPREYWEKRLRSGFTLKGVGNIVFDANYNEYLYKLQLGVLKKAIAKYGIRLPGARVLDVGCGTGFFSEFYIGGLAEVTGIDIAEISIESLGKTMPDGRFLTVDISAEGFHNHIEDGERFDIINIFNVLYHVVDDNKFAKAIENVTTSLTPGGHIFITDYLGEEDYSPAEHVQFRSIQKYRSLFHDKIDVVDVLPLYHLMNRRTGLLSLRINNLISPLLFAFDATLNELGLNFMSNMKLLIGKKPSGGIEPGRQAV